MSRVVNPSITVKVLCFAQLRDRTGASELAVRLPAGATGADLLARLNRRHPGLGPLLRVCRLAVNQEYAADDTPLHENDEIAVIPPVSGG